MSIKLNLKYASMQEGEKLMKVIGLLSAQELAKMMGSVQLDPNPRSPNVNKITKAIVRTLENDATLLQYKTKGMLAAGKVVSCQGDTFEIDFSVPSGGILDGGHNFFAVVRQMMIEAVRHKYSSQRAEDKRARKEVEKVRSWRDLRERWRTYGDDVRAFVESIQTLRPGSGNAAQDKIVRRFSFLMPIEIVSPRPRVSPKEVKEIIHEISVARNNNVQLKDVAIAQHKGSYEYLKRILPDVVNQKVQWKSGENQCPIPPTKIVPLALLPLKKLEDAGVIDRLCAAITTDGDVSEEGEEQVSFPAVKLMSMYTSTAGSVSIYSQIVDAVSNLEAEDDSNDDLKTTIIRSLEVIRDLPELWDTLEYSFEDLFGYAVHGNERSYSELSCNNKGPAKKESPTRYFTRQIPKGRFVARAGFITPLFMSIASSFMAYDPDQEQVVWTVPVDNLIREIELPSKAMKDMMREYVKWIRVSEYDPSKFGKNPFAYEALFGNQVFLKWVSNVKHS